MAAKRVSVQLSMQMFVDRITLEIKQLFLCIAFWGKSISNTQQTTPKADTVYQPIITAFFSAFFLQTHLPLSIQPSLSQDSFISWITKTLFLVSGRVYANLIYGCWRASVRWKCITLWWAAPLADGVRWVIFAGSSPGVTAPSSPRDSRHPDSRHPVHLCWRQLSRRRQILSQSTSLSSKPPLHTREKPKDIFHPLVLRAILFQLQIFAHQIRT